MTSERRDFHVLVVDREDARRERFLDWLTELGFGSVQVASAPDSAAVFADAQPPHIAMIAFDDENEAKLTVEKLRAVSSETQIILHTAENFESLSQARDLAATFQKNQAVWDVCVIPEDESRGAGVRALELAVDRACKRLYFQFETEQWKERWQQVAPKSSRDPLAVQERLYACVQEFSKLRDLESVIAAATHAFSRASDGRQVVYLRWVPIRSSFVIARTSDQTGEMPDVKVRGLGLTLSLGTSAELAEREEVKEFVRDVFGADTFTLLPHGAQGTVQEPTGLFLLIGTALENSNKDEFAAISFLFDLTWTRLEALRDRHALERVDRSTGLPNKRAFREAMDFECVRARRLRHPVSSAAIEIGGVGTSAELEERLGASYDAVLKVVGTTLRRALRGTDFVARAERGRFAVLMPHTSVAEAVSVIDRMCRLIERLQLPALESIGVSHLKARAGVAEYPRLAGDADALLLAMDDALMAAWSGLGDHGVHVMVFEVPPGFQPDFEPTLSPGSPS
ncbi:MAG: GGDEF domain-containing protein [Bdellovibrionales bacterium]|jgi:diguanylate cyclase (GGDEF)-like protein|nr:GGDEF domain-containing protein [Bdellovibrionales bacterium]